MTVVRSPMEIAFFLGHKERSFSTTKLFPPNMSTDMEETTSPENVNGIFPL